MLWNFSARQIGAAAVLVLLCLLFGGVIYVEGGGTPSEPGAGTTAASDGAPPPSVAAPAPNGLPPVETYSEVTQRPLFSATRQPAPQAAQDNSAKTGSLALVGIVIGDDGRTALIQHGHPAVLTRLKEGQAVEGWTIKSILPDRITLLGAGAQQELKLKDQPAQQQQGLPAPQPGQPGPPGPARR